MVAITYFIYLQISQERNSWAAYEFLVVSYTCRAKVSLLVLFTNALYSPGSPNSSVDGQTSSLLRAPLLREALRLEYVSNSWSAACTVGSCVPFAWTGQLSQVWLGSITRWRPLLPTGAWQLPIPTRTAHSSSLSLLCLPFAFPFLMDTRNIQLSS